uniref:transcription-repair coupling factor n=1 Tax=Desulforadius tongensis TaxID=1216062 RepID=UPI00195D79B1|nr:transcription-repair coupling factor [Desulforadius tongensis]
MDKINQQQLTGLLRPLADTAEFQNLVKSLQKGFDQQVVFGLAGSQRALVMAGLISARPGPALVIVPAEAEAAALADDLQFLLPDREVVIFPVWQSMPLEVLSSSNEVIIQRLKVLNGLVMGKPLVVVAPGEAIMRRLVPPEIFKSGHRKIEVGQRVDLEDLEKFLVRQGYERVDLIQGVGQFSVRGGILDIYPVMADKPVRLELWDDEVESIRTFNVHSQRSEEELPLVEITPAGEMVVCEEKWPEGRQKLLKEYRAQLKNLDQNATLDARHQLAAQVESWLTRLEQPVYFAGVEQLLPFFYPRPVSLMNYLPAEAVVLVDDPLRVKEMVEIIQRERGETHTELLSKGKVLPSQYGIYLEWRQFLAALTRRQSVAFSFLPRNPQFLNPKNIVNFTAKTMHPFLGNTGVLVDEIKQWKRKKNSVVLLVSNRERAQNLLQSLKENKVDAFYMSRVKNEVVPGNVVITEGNLSAGFELVSARAVVITEKEIFGQRKKPKRRRDKTEPRLAPFEDLKINDYVVHVNHGIGRYKGITTLDIGGVQRDYLLVEYAGDDKVYVPTDQVGLLQRYSGNEGAAPKLSKLGGSEWTRAKNKVRQAVKEIARDLVVLYAARQTAKGYAFSRDTEWQKEFEMAFPYEETKDQLKAIAEVKKDMEKPRPMDRLLCGDVGYGKTEVALRAAFKAVSDGKQVAVLVPTTILAQQHYNTFRERFAHYPVTIEMLSRFRTLKEQRAVIKGLEEGTVDVVIGTHRLVQSDVKFKDLGLVVIDEEQRFGVAHKERLKKLRTTVDVLTLTATPIPRTLHMSLVGVRDTSLLETPPEERFPVQTYVLEEDPVMIREAIRREINRGGQVFFVHNRVAELDTVAEWLSGLVPEARLVVAHGQMREERLEKVMLEFMAGNHDVLVCTTIIETGLDIPNVNTLIVKDADRFGLAQLYQLRGRVGRSNRLAYAYFTFRRDKVLTEEAEKRLSAIRDFTELGSGYKIAMRDLEIRGAGNILGAEQHGHIAEVGFDLYCKMLEDAIREIKGEEKEEPVETAVELPVNAYIPDRYINDQSQKVELYRRIARFTQCEQVEDLREELLDRYGELPEPVQRLLLVAEIKIKGGKLKIKSINYQRRMFKLVFAPNPPVNVEKLVQLGQRYRNRIKFNNTSEEFEIKLKTRDITEMSTGGLKELSGFIDQLQ